MRMMKSDIAPNGRVFYADQFDDFSKRPPMAERSSLLRNILFRNGGMATFYSDTMAAVRLGKKVAPSAHRGKVQSVYWDFASLPANTAADIFVCAKLYKGDRCIGGLENHGALTSGGGTATGAYGTYAVGSDGITLGAVDDVDRFLAAASLEAAGMTVINNTHALYYGFECPTDLFVCLTNSVEAFATAGRVSGHLLIVRD